MFEYEDGVFNKDFSEVRVGTDFYFDLQGEGGSDPEDDEKRVTFGELNANKDFEGGVRLNMEGEFDWHPPSQRPGAAEQAVDPARTQFGDGFYRNSNRSL
ncbi:MAG: hypothetical protein U5P10_08300 [Spirochaetia bacterium]|nr:hypothetical protein [Spirochaetia bacterium]